MTESKASVIERVAELSTIADATATRDRNARLATLAFAAYTGVSFFVLLHIGRRMWFYEDDWSFLRRRMNWSGLFQPFFQHWITAPLLLYHLFYRAFGANYLPFEIAIVAAHLALAVLLRVVMRRAGVSPWLATVAAGAFVLFGPGHEGVMVSVQITLVGSALFGIGQLLCADHDGPFMRRDAVGLVLGALGVMSSGIGTIMILIVGIGVLIRRGWRMALVHTVPLVALDVLWYTIEGQWTSGRHSHSVLGDAVRWNISGERAVFAALGGYAVVGVALGVMLVVGLVLAWRPLASSEFRRRAAAPAALLAGGPVLFTLTSIQRGYLPNYETTSRFINLAAAFVLPALAVAADAVARRWRATTLLVAMLFLVGAVLNAGRFPPESNFPSGFFEHDKAMLLGAAYSPLAEGTPRDLQPYAQLFHARGVTMGFLVDARKSGRLPRPPRLSTADQQELLVRLGVEQMHGPGPSNARCKAYYQPLVLAPVPGTVYVLQSYVAVHYGDRVGDYSRNAVLFEPSEGTVLKVLAPGLKLTVSNVYDPKFPFTFCSA